MIRIKGLSIGDLVVINGEPARALRLTQVGYSVFKGLSGQMYRVIGDIYPLPITPEILEKNGVALAEDYDENGGLFTCPAFSVVKYGDGYTFEMPQARVRVEHVHELQHAMRLAGIEKEIEL